MKDTTLKTLGNLAIIPACGEPHTHFRTQKCAELLGLLVRHHRCPVHREALGEYLWPGADPKIQRNRLRYELCLLRQLLPRTAIEAQGHHYVRLVAPSDYALFDELAKQALIQLRPNQRIIALEAALTHYQGEFLPGHYAEWVLQERTRLEALHTLLLSRLCTDLQAQGQHETADYWSLKRSH